MHIFKALH